MYVAKTKALISFADTAKLTSVFVFAYAKTRFSHDAALFIEFSNLLVRARSLTFIQIQKLSAEIRLAYGTRLVKEYYSPFWAIK